MSLARFAAEAAWFAATNRTLEDSIAAAHVRARLGDWNTPGARGDLAALELESALVARELRDAEQPAEAAAGLIDLTWDALSRRTGYLGPSSADQAAEQASPAEANVAAIAVAIVGVGAMAAVYAWAIYRGSQIVSDELARRQQAAELIRAHSQALEVLSRHREAEAKAGRALVYDSAELAILEQLKAAQAGLNRATPNVPERERAEVGMFAGLGGLGMAAAAALLVAWFVGRTRPPGS